MKLDKQKFRPLEEVEMPDSQRDFLRSCGVGYAYKYGDRWYAERRICGVALYFYGRGDKADSWERVF